MGSGIAQLYMMAGFLLVEGILIHIEIEQRNSIDKFSPLEMREYEASKKAYRDIKNSVDTAKREGIAEGMEKGMKQGMEKGIEKSMKQGMEKGLEQRSLEIARKMLAKGMDAASVMEITGLSAEQMQQLKA